tara:strand:+ start:302 stop:880 length:579 start_codon:yes stop_codon:yes gene_type:complete
VKVGVLALQGAFGRHGAVLTRLGATAVEVRTPEALAGVDALVIPGGESTTTSMLLEWSGLADPIGERLADGLPVLGTCAGMILLSTRILDGRQDQVALGAVDLDVRRNGYGRQIDSFEADLDVDGLDGPFHGVFIRAPVVERVGEGVEVLATIDGQPVLCRQGPTLVAAFHPELAEDDRIHREFLNRAFTGA